MKIFPKADARYIYQAKSLEELLCDLQPWVQRSVREESALFLATAGYILRPIGGFYAPKILKRLVIKEIIRLTGVEDLESCVNLALVEAYRSWLPGAGTDRINWLSWKVPYYLSKLVTWRTVHPIEPMEHLVEMLEPQGSDAQTDIIASEIGLSPSHKAFYKEKLEERV